MRPNQIFANGIITNQGKLEELKRVIRRGLIVRPYPKQESSPSKVVIFTLELTTLALVLAVVVALAIVIQPI